MSAKNDDVRDLHELAALFRVSEKTIRSWIGAGMPIVQAGESGGRRRRTRISLRAAAAWFFKTNFEKFELLRAQTGLNYVRADREQLDNLATRREFARLEWIEEIFRDYLAEIIARAREIPARLTPALEGLDVHQRKSALDCEIFAFLDYFAPPLTTGDVNAEKTEAHEIETQNPADDNGNRAAAKADSGGNAAPAKKARSAPKVKLRRR